MFPSQTDLPLAIGVLVLLVVSPRVHFRSQEAQ
jgi:hypothetical protein